MPPNKGMELTVKSDTPFALLLQGVVRGMPPLCGFAPRFRRGKYFTIQSTLWYTGTGIQVGGQHESRYPVRARRARFAADRPIRMGRGRVFRSDAGPTRRTRPSFAMPSGRRNVRPSSPRSETSCCFAFFATLLTALAARRPASWRSTLARNFVVASILVVTLEPRCGPSLLELPPAGSSRPAPSDRGDGGGVGARTARLRAPASGRVRNPARRAILGLIVGQHPKFGAVCARAGRRTSFVDHRHSQLTQVP